jgi:hypothetical protein
MPLLRIYFSEKQKKVVTFDNLFLFPNIINTNRTVIILTIDLENLPSNFPEILQQERAVVAQWKPVGFLEQLY